MDACAPLTPEVSTRRPARSIAPSEPTICAAPPTQAAQSSVAQVIDSASGRAETMSARAMRPPGASTLTTPENTAALFARRLITPSEITWHLDLWLDPDGTPTWKDEDQASQAVAAGHPSQPELELAGRTGHDIISRIDTWTARIGDWTSNQPPATWAALPLPGDWTA